MERNGKGQIVETIDAIVTGLNETHCLDLLHGDGESPVLSFGQQWRLHDAGVGGCRRMRRLGGGRPCCRLEGIESLC